MKMKPLFVYAGGKTKLIKQYQHVIPTQFNSYVEPFVGGGSIFLWLKQQNPDAKYIINDINEEIISIYKHIRDEPERFIKYVDIWERNYLQCSSKEVKKFFYYGCRKDYWLTPEDQLFDLPTSARLYALMKTSFNGVWQTCFESGGRFGTSCGLLNQTDRIYDKEQVLAWSEILKGVEILSCDFKSLDIPKGSVVVCDGPYRNSFTDYGTRFDDNSQKRLVSTCLDWKSQGNQVFLANRECDDNFFETLLPNSTFHKFPIKYTAGRRKKTDSGYEAKSATELLIEI